MKHRGKFASIAIIVVALFAVVASSSDEEGAEGDAAPGGGNASEAGAADEVDDVKVDSCQADPTLPNVLKSGLTITNNSSEPSNYLITVSFESPDGATKYGSGNAAVQSLASGQTTPVEAIGTGSVSGELVCKVTDVERFAS